MADLPVMPRSLPGPEFSSMKWDPLFDNVIRSNMDLAVKFRPRATSVPKLFSCALYVTPAQLETLMDFREITLASTGRFQWYDFLRPSNTVDLATYSFSAEPSPETWEDIYKVTLSLVMWKGVLGRNPLANEAGKILLSDDGVLST